MSTYEMDLTRMVGTTERTRDAGRRDGQTDGRSETNIPPTTSLCWGIIMATVIDAYMCQSASMSLKSQQEV